MLEELALYLIFGHAELFADMHPTVFEDGLDDWREWLAEILGDLDIEFLLFTSDMALTPDSSYHFDHWNQSQFYLDEGVEPGTEQSIRTTGAADAQGRRTTNDGP